jgi:hypothetical protein
MACARTRGCKVKANAVDGRSSEVRWEDGELAVNDDCVWGWNEGDGDEERPTATRSWCWHLALASALDSGL